MKNVKFSFVGHEHTYVCDTEGAHPPHTTGGYDTVNYGGLNTFCLGRAGKTPKGELIIHIEKYSRGCADYPATARGNYYITEKGGKEDV